MRGLAIRMSLSKKAFASLAGKGAVPPLFAEIPYESPSVIYPKFSGPDSFIFESVKGPPKIASYSFIGFEPYMKLAFSGGMLEMSSGGRRSVTSQRLLTRLREITRAYRQLPSPELPPFQGGAAGLMSYDFARYLEKIPDMGKPSLGIPDADFFVIDRLMAFDHFAKKAWAVVCPGLRDTGFGYYGLGSVNWAEKYDAAEDTIRRISAKASERHESPSGPIERSPILHETSEDRYTEMVMRAKEYIAAGDIFQTNLSLRVSAGIGRTEPWGLYTRLRAVNPAPFACFMDFGGYHIASSSPERLLLVKDGLIETRPIAGTRPRGKDTAEDEAMRAELLLSEKERAEHIMLTDLERNDIGRVSDYGSVHVDELMTTEDYSHVIHIVSNIRGRLAKGKDAYDAIKAVFPGGTITGVPKVRCMEIIEELEPVKRGPYTGSAGYVGFSGSADFNIIIRTFVIKDGTAYVQAGAGIVADSRPEREYSESLKKAEALINVLSGDINLL